MKTLNWYLNDVYPAMTGDLLQTLTEPFEHDVLQNLHNRLDFNHRNITRFEKMDLEQGGPMWRSVLARKLFSIRKVAMVKADQMMHGLDKLSKEYNKFWLLKNCRPSGGNWMPDQKLALNNPTGKHCLSWLCPWCWIRRTEFLRAMSMAPAGQEVKLCGDDSKGLGLPENVEMISFVVTGEIKPDGSDDVLNEEVVGSLIRAADHAVTHRHLASGGSYVIQKNKPEFGVGLKVFAPIFVRKPQGTGHVVGWKVSYIHDGSSSQLGDLTIPGIKPIQVHRFGSMPFMDALRLAYRSPIDLLHNDTAPNVIMRFVTVLKNKRYFTSKRFKKVQAPVQPAHCA